MPHFLRAADRDVNAHKTIKFEGASYGTSISFFAVVAAPGKGVALHVHPYSESWMVQQGSVRFRAGVETFAAGPGGIMIVEPETPHGFENVGEGELKMMCIHDSPTIIQTFLETDDD